jgi:hypothetical protein
MSQLANVPHSKPTVLFIIAFVLLLTYFSFIEIQCVTGDLHIFILNFSDAQTISGYPPRCWTNQEHSLNSINMRFLLSVVRKAFIYL